MTQSKFYSGVLTGNTNSSNTLFTIPACIEAILKYMTVEAYAVNNLGEIFSLDSDVSINDITGLIPVADQINTDNNAGTFISATSERPFQSVAKLDSERQYSLTVFSAFKNNLPLENITSITFYYQLQIDLEV
jgi:hypothetical protein